MVVITLTTQCDALISPRITSHNYKLEYAMWKMAFA